LAQGGTLFLDEISELDLPLQAKTLQAIEDTRFYPVGSTKLAEVKCRIVASSNQPLKELSEQGKFRPDLLHRLLAFPLNLPPLRERKEDILPLAEHYLQVFGKELGLTILRLGERAAALLTAYPWPGNVRELMNVLRSAALFNRGGTIGLEALAAYPGIWEETDTEDTPAKSDPGGSLPTLGEAERDLIRRTLEHCKGNKSQAARILGISRSHLRYRMMLHDL
jgi:DNA-binding NtrC family response regulator